VFQKKKRWKDPTDGRASSNGARDDRFPRPPPTLILAAGTGRPASSPSHCTAGELYAHRSPNSLPSEPERWVRSPEALEIGGFLRDVRVQEEAKKRRTRTPTRRRWPAPSRRPSCGADRIATKNWQQALQVGYNFAKVDYDFDAQQSKGSTQTQCYRIKPCGQGRTNMT
jgi:hypothetical protein